jgi:uncharacterized protein YegP (UPF0339 family)
LALADKDVKRAFGARAQYQETRFQEDGEEYGNAVFTVTAAAGVMTIELESCAPSKVVGFDSKGPDGPCAASTPPAPPAANNGRSGGTPAGATGWSAFGRQEVYKDAIADGLSDRRHLLHERHHGDRLHALGGDDPTEPEPHHASDARGLPGLEPDLALAPDVGHTGNSSNSDVEGRSMAAKFEIRSPKAGEYRWVLVSQGRTLATSEAYSRRGPAEKAIDSFRLAAIGAPVIDTTVPAAKAATRQAARAVGRALGKAVVKSGRTVEKAEKKATKATKTATRAVAKAASTAKASATKTAAPRRRSSRGR